ncbi:hypothetical protein PG994_002191 [Apiospora phragmitis]|uniref:Uncharacterized protein n=1 Tax=Apiospora phragmitis TaxID=2905665 RepID=A0ABR1WVN3_9PEZI
MATGTSSHHQQDPPASASLADALRVAPRHGIFVDDRTNDRLRRCRYVPYPDLSAMESFVSSSTPIEDVTARWECKHGTVPVLVIEHKPVLKPIKAKL